MSTQLVGERGGVGLWLVEPQDPLEVERGSQLLDVGVDAAPAGIDLRQVAEQLGELLDLHAGVAGRSFAGAAPMRRAPRSVLAAVMALAAAAGCTAEPTTTETQPDELLEAEQPAAEPDDTEPAETQPDDHVKADQPDTEPNDSDAAENQAHPGEAVPRLVGAEVAPDSQDAYALYDLEGRHAVLLMSKEAELRDTPAEREAGWVLDAVRTQRDQQMDRAPGTSALGSLPKVAIDVVAAVRRRVSPRDRS